MLGIVLLGAILAFVTHTREIQIAAVDIVERHGGRASTVPRLFGIVDALVRADLSGTRFDDGDLEVACRPGTIEWLFVDGTDITDDGMRHIGDLRHLRSLDISNTEIGDEGLREMRSVQSLESLIAKNIGASDHGLAEIVSACPGVVNVDLSGTNAGQRVCTALSSKKYLEWCRLDATEVSDVGVAKFGCLPSLRLLSLRGTAVTGKGISQVAAAPSLAVLDLRETAMSAVDVRQLTQEHPKLRILWP